MFCRNCNKLHRIKTSRPPKIDIWSESQPHSWLPCVSYCYSLLKPSNSRSHTSNAKAEKWRQPKGYDTGIMIYQPLVKQKVPLILQQPKLAQWYACGPTVYDSAHIGHASSYIRKDIIRRILEKVFHIDTTLVMGVTDIDDKIIHRSKETGQDVGTLTKFYETEFFTDMANLNMTPPTIISRVCDHIPQIVSFVEVLEDKGVAYQTKDGSVYFDVKKYGKYGQFAMQRDDRPTDEDKTVTKRSSQDFALWKAHKDGEPCWPSRWGPGRPGWHVECSAMASGIFGSNFDFHSGGEDLIFPHHENELAQSCAFHGNDQWVNYWVHTGHLFTPGQVDKMSKSLKNTISIAEFLSSYSANHFRMLCLLSHYKKRIEFSDDRLQKAVSVLSSIHSIIQRCELYAQGQLDLAHIPEAELYEKLHETKAVVENAFRDDFNTPKALANIMRLIKYLNQLLETPKPEVTARGSAPVAATGGYLRGLMEQLGLDIGGKKIQERAEGQVQFYKAVDSIVQARSEMRNFARDKQHMVHSAGELGIPEATAKKLMKSLYKPLWQTSDTIRQDLLTSANIQISDGADGSTWAFVDSKVKAEREDDSTGQDKSNDQTSS